MLFVTSEASILLKINDWHSQNAQKRTHFWLQTNAIRAEKVVRNSLLSLFEPNLATRRTGLGKTRIAPLRVVAARRRDRDEHWRKQRANRKTPF
jgi:hypothetical protein